MTESIDYLDGLDDITTATGLEETGQAAPPSTGQKGLDYSKLEDPVKIFQVADDRQKNIFDIIPFFVTQDWYEKLLFSPPTQTQRAAGNKYARPRGRKVGQVDACFEIPFHRYADGESGDVICLREAFGEKCPHCERMFEEYENRNNGDPKADEKAKSLKPKWRSFYNIYNHNTGEYEVIDDMARTSFQANLEKCSRHTKEGQPAVYPYAHPIHGYTLITKSIFNEPTSEKYGNGHTEFLDVDFEKRPDDEVFTKEDMEAGVSFDALATDLIFSYDEMKEMVRKKMGDPEVVDQAQTNKVDTKINELPEQQEGTTPEGDAIDDAPAFQQEAGSRSRRARGSRGASNENVEDSPKEEPKQEEKKEESTRSRRPRR